jgi:hypothetical protein
MVQWLCTVGEQANWPLLILAGSLLLVAVVALVGAIKTPSLPEYQRDTTHESPSR